MLSQMWSKNAKLVSGKGDNVAAMIQHEGWEFSLMSRMTGLSWKIFCLLFSWDHAREFVNVHWGSRDLGIYQNTIPNMEKDTKECRVRGKEYWKLYLRFLPWIMGNWVPGGWFKLGSPIGLLLEKISFCYCKCFMLLVDQLLL